MAVKKITYVSDAAHGWYSVPIKDLHLFNLIDEISRYSYMDTHRVYLEEDRDAPLYFDALRKAGTPYEIVEATGNTRYTKDGKCYVRYRAPYDPEWVRKPLQVGRLVYCKQDRKIRQVTGRTKTHWVLDNVYLVANRNPFKDILSSAPE